MTENPKSESFLSHIDALRSTLLWCIASVAIAFPFCYMAAPFVIDLLIEWCCPAEIGQLHFFSPMEAFLVELKMALILAICLTYPFNAFKVWKFLMPALYEPEKKALRYWIVFSGILFFGGVGFCLKMVLPLIMNFAASFARPGLQPMLGLGNFLEMAMWLMLAFGLMFQTPIVVLLLVRFGLAELATLNKMRPYIIVGLLIAAGILTPPDIISQLLLFIPTWLLWELGIFIAGRTVKPPENAENPEVFSTIEPSVNSAARTDNGMENFYLKESERK